MATYTGTITDLLTRPDIAALFYLRISGIPIIWGAGALPSDWGSGGSATLLGDTYAWQTTLNVGSNFGQVSTKVEPKAGVGTTGGQSFTIGVTGSDNADADTMLSLLVKDLTRSDQEATNLRTTCTAVETGAIGVDSTVGFTAAANIYVGTETIKHSGVTSTTFTGLTRGAYGSWSQIHRAVTVLDADTGETAPNGAFIGDWPLVWDGRVVELYMAFGRWYQGGFEPYADGSGDPVQQMVYRGVLNGVIEGGDTLTVKLKTSSLDQVMAAEVATRLPRAQLAGWTEDITNGWFYVGNHNKWLSWRWDRIDAASTEIAAYTGKPLLDGTSAVAEGLYDKELIKRFIIDTIRNETMPAGMSGGTAQFIDRSLDSGYGADFRYNIVLIFDVTAVAAYTLTLYVNTGARTSIIRDLGYTEDVAADSYIDFGLGVQRMVFPDAQQAPPALLWPAPPRILQRIYYTNKTSGPSFDATPGWETDAGNAMDGIVRIDDKVVVGFGGTGSTILNGVSYPYLEVIRTWQIPDEGYEVKYDPNKTKGGELLQGIGLYDISLGRALLYLGISGSGTPGTLDADYDQGWSGSGLALPANLWNKTELESISQDTQLRELIWIDEPTQLRKVMGAEVQYEQVILVAIPDWTANTGPQMTMITTAPPSEVDVSTSAHVIDETNLMILGGGEVGLDRREDKIINVATIEMGYLPASKKAKAIINQRHETSIQTWGARDKIKLKVKSLGLYGTSEASQDVAKDLAQVLFDRYAYPYEVWELDLARPEAWAWRIGDAVAITSDHLPSVATAGRGVTLLPGIIYQKKDSFTGGDGVATRLTIVSRASLGERRSQWGPSMRLNSYHVTQDVWNVVGHEFSDSADDIDLSHFAVGDYIHYQEIGGLGRSDKTITAIDLVNGRVTFSATIAKETPPFIVTFSAYSQSSTTDRQRTYVAFSDGDGVLTKSSGSDVAYKYGA